MAQILEPYAGSASAELSSAAGKAAISWPAIVAGAFVAVAVSLALFALGSALGFASISPWPGRGVSATTFAVTTAIWLIVMQWLSAAFGGYIAGRLRTRWIGTHTHEVFFRDTAHGFVTWAVSTVIVAGLIAASAFSAFGGGAKALSSVAAGAAQSMTAGSESDYNVDKLLRSSGTTSGNLPSGNLPSGNLPPSDARAEARDILANAMSSHSVPDADKSYLADLVAARSGVSQADARVRVDDFVAGAMQAEAKLKVAADEARKASAEAAIYTALAMLVGAFIASVSAALGGRLRDEHI